MSRFRTPSRARRFPRGRRMATRTAVARKADKRFTWVDCLTSACEPTFVDYFPQTQEVCTQVVKYVLLDNQVLQDKFSDQATVVALRGYMSFLPVPKFDPDPLVNAAWTAELGLASAMGLRKVDITQAQPNGDTYDLIVGDDWTESRQRRTWEHHAWPKGDVFSVRGSIAGGRAGVCSNVSGKFKDCIDEEEVCIEPVALTDGSGYTWQLVGPGGTHDPVTYDVSTNCQLIDETQDNIAMDYTTSLKTLQPWKWNLTGRQHYKLVEDEQLTLQQTIAPFTVGNTPAVDMFAGYYWYARVKALLQF